MSLRPQDLPELRRELVADLSEWSEDFDAMLPSSDPRRRERGARLYEMTRQSMSAAPLFWVSSSMVDLCEVSAQTLPRFELHPDDLPHPDGVMLFESPWTCGGDQPVAIGGVHWNSGGGALTVLPIVADSESAMRASPTLFTVPKAMAGTRFGTADWDEWAPGGSKRELLPFTLAAWLLMNQPLSVEAEVELGRAARKRLRRMAEEPRPVRVINLRRSRGGAEKGNGSREYRHQWITRGHWRQHWYPKRQVHRPVWIAPHIKGPEGAPLIGGEKVYAWKR